MIEYAIFTYDDLSKEQLYQILQLRQEVFVVEQYSPYLDADGHDQDSWHFLGYNHEKVVGYARIRLREGDNPTVKLERLLLLPQFRKLGEGANLIRKLIKYAEGQFPGFRQEAAAQSRLIGYYQQFGFEPEGEDFDDGGVLHRKIIRQPLG